MKDETLRKTLSWLILEAKRKTKRGELDFLEGANLIGKLTNTLNRHRELTNVAEEEEERAFHEDGRPVGHMRQ